MNCKECGGVVEAEMQAEFEEAKEILRDLGRDPNLQLTCQSCSLRLFGETEVH